MLKKILVILLIGTTLCFGASTKIEDNTTSGYKADVFKSGTDYGLGVIVHSKKYMPCNKDDDASPYYYGFEAADGSWYIMKWTVSAGDDVFAYCRGDGVASSYATNWTGRAGLTYASWGTTF
jgi:hypothetical protein